LTTLCFVHILEKIMLRRLIALFFILTLAGQVLAGVCVCLDETGGKQAKSSCCLRKKAQQPSMKRKACCPTPCGESSDSIPGSQSESSVKVPLVVRKAVEKFVFSLAPRAVYAAAAPTALKRDETAPQKISKPPILYLQNHAFLI
jgi:hypothetical protein